MDLTTMDGWQRLFEQSHPVRGGVDFHVMAMEDLCAYSTAFGFVTSLARDETRAPAFPDIYIVLPVQSMEEGASFEAGLVRRLPDMCERVVKSDQVEGLLKIVRSRIHVVSMLEHEVEQLAAYVAALPVNACVLVLKGERFTSPNVSPPIELMTAQVLRDEILQLHAMEDVWVPQVIHLHERLIQAAVERKPYILVQVNQDPPARLENINAIRNCSGGLVFGESNSTKKSRIFLANFERWAQMIGGGDEERAFSEIDATAFDPLNIALVKAQCLLAADRGPLAFELLLPFREELVSEAPAHIAHLAARLARQAGQKGDSVALLERAIHAQDCDLECLRSSLKLARLLENRKLVSETRELLLARYPNSDEAVRAKFVPLLSSGRFAEVANSLRPIALESHRASLARYLFFLAEAFTQDPIPDYRGYIQKVREEMGDEQAGLAGLDSLRDSLRRGVMTESVCLLLEQPWSKELLEDVAQLGLRVLEHELLAPVTAGMTIPASSIPPRRES